MINAFAVSRNPEVIKVRSIVSCIFSTEIDLAPLAEIVSTTVLTNVSKSSSVYFSLLSLNAAVIASYMCFGLKFLRLLSLLVTYVSIYFPYFLLIFLLRFQSNQVSEIELAVIVYSARIPQKQCTDIQYLGVNPRKSPIYCGLRQILIFCKFFFTYSIL